MRGSSSWTRCVLRLRSLSGSSWLVGLASLGWLALRSGAKPSRLAYPCQQAALASSSVLVPAAVLAAAHRVFRLVQCRVQISFRRVVVGPLLVLVMVGGISSHSSRLETEEVDPGPIGVAAVNAAGHVYFATGPRARDIPSPHRVVSVRDPLATSWDFSCTGSGYCDVYYGDDSYVDQAVIDEMVAQGLEELTDAPTVEAAWQVLLPDYVTGQTVAIKLNFNDSIMGGGTSGYGDDDAYVDALPQIVNSLADGLISFGFEQNEIWLYDASRYLTDRFRSRIHYPGIRCFDHYGNGADVEPAAFALGVGVDFSASGYPGSHTITDVLVQADYLVNLPIMKRHGGAGITLALKNHLGTIDGFYTGGHSMHAYFYLGGGSYDPDKNPIVDISCNPEIRDKTVLVVGDALYGAWPDNNEPPSRWSSFGDDSPNMLFFAVDPVAVDSVMTDYLRREGSFSAAANDILMVAAAAGLGVYEHWNNDQDRQYQVIDYVEIDREGLLFADDFESGDGSAWSAVVP